MKSMNKPVTLLFFVAIFLSCQNDCEIVGGEKFKVEAEICGLESERIDTLTLNQKIFYRYVWEGIEETKAETLYEYKIKITNYPKSFINSDSSFQLIEGFLKSTISSFFDNKEYEYVNSTYIFLEGFPGTNFLFKNLQTNRLFESRCYLVDSHLIEIETVSPSSNWYSIGKDRFFESVKLINRPANKKDYGIPIIESDTYTIDFPKTPETTNIFVDSENGLVNLRIKVYERKRRVGNITFISSETKFADKFKVGKEELESFYNRGMMGSINSMNGKFLSKKEITYKGNKGLAFCSSLHEGIHFVSYRIFFIEGTLYSFGVLHTDNEVNVEGEKFMNSFKRETKAEHSN